VNHEAGTPHSPNDSIRTAVALADEKLRAVFGGKDKVSMFEMNKHFAQHLA